MRFQKSKIGGDTLYKRGSPMLFFGRCMIIVFLRPLESTRKMQTRFPSPLRVLLVLNFSHWEIFRGFHMSQPLHVVIPLFGGAEPSGMVAPAGNSQSRRTGVLKKPHRTLCKQDRREETCRPGHGFLAGCLRNSLNRKIKWHIAGAVSFTQTWIYGEQSSDGLSRR